LIEEVLPERPRAAPRPERLPSGEALRLLLFELPYWEIISIIWVFKDVIQCNI